MVTNCRFLRALAALVLSCWFAMPEAALAQMRASLVGVVRDEFEPCLAFDPDGALVECLDVGSFFQGIGRAAVPTGGAPTIVLTAGAAIQSDPSAPQFESVNAQAMLQDLVTLTGVSATARVTFVVRVSGLLSQQSPPDATATLQVDVLGQGQFWNTDQSVDETILVTLDLTPGVPQDVTMFASARASMLRSSPGAPGGSAGVGLPAGASVRIEGVQVTDIHGAPLPGASLVSELGYSYLVLGSPPAFASLGPAIVWIGLTDPLDRTPLDVRAEVYVNDTLISSGELRCLRELVARPRRKHEMTVPLGAPADIALEAGDVLSLRLLSRIGTNPDGTACVASHGGDLSSEGLRVFYDSEYRPARLLLTIDGEAPSELFLRSDGRPCKARKPTDPTDLVLDAEAPTAERVKCRDSGPLSFTDGNPWVEIDTWDTTLPATP